MTVRLLLRDTFTRSNLALAALLPETLAHQDTGDAERPWSFSQRG